jgi:hypothetical protein
VHATEVPPQPLRESGEKGSVGFGERIGRLFSHGLPGRDNGCCLVIREAPSEQGAANGGTGVEGELG